MGKRAILFVLCALYAAERRRLCSRFGAVLPRGLGLSVWWLAPSALHRMVWPCRARSYRHALALSVLWPVRMAGCEETETRALVMAVYFMRMVPRQGVKPLRGASLPVPAYLWLQSRGRSIAAFLVFGTQCPFVHWRFTFVVCTVSFRVTVN